MKKVIPLILALAIVFSFGLVTALANPPRSITIGAFTYDLDHRSYTAIVSAYKPLDGFSNTDSPNTHLCIPSKISFEEKNYNVVAIADGVFANQSDIIAIIIPSTMLEIGNRVFENCTGLKSVAFAPNSGLKGLGKSAFANCKTLEAINLPASVVYIGNRAFQGCSGLKSIQIPSCLKRIETLTFAECKSLTWVEIPNTIEVIAPFAFIGCHKLESLQIQQDSALKEIEELAFADCTSLKHIFIPESVKLLGNGAFASCSNLKTVTLRNKNVQLKENVFDVWDLDSPSWNPDITPNSNLSTIFFAGNRDEWEAIVKNSGQNLTLSPENKNLTVIFLGS